MAGKEVIERYRKYQDVRGTQLIFSDMGTPLKHARKEIAEYEELRVIAAGADPDTVARAEFGDEAAMMKIEEAEKARETLDGKGMDWLDAIKAAMRGFSVYNDMKAYLMENDVPANEIAIVRAEKTRVDRVLFEFAKLYPDLWTLDTAPIVRTVNPVTGFVEEHIDPAYKQRRTSSHSRSMVRNTR